MTLTFKHFDTRLNQWLHSDNNTANPESLIKEELDNTLVEFFLPDKQFSFGQVDKYSTATDLKNHPNGHKLLLASGSRLLYGSEECQRVIDKLCPDRKDRGAYGSIFLGGCNNAINEKLNILVVDDKTGNNGGVIDTDQALKLTGDCYGQIEPRLYDLLTGRELNSGKSYAVVQHRFGWREGDGKDSTFRFGKGTLRPHQLDKLNYADPNITPQIDLIIPLSSFKGTNKDNPKGATKPQIAPGLYNQTIWLGVKSQSQQGKTAISQLLASFPQGFKDFVEVVELQAQELAQKQSDPRLLAQLYCESYEKRLADIAAAKNEEDTSLDNLENEETLGNDSAAADISAMYKIIKADVESGHFQLLETEKVKLELSRFVQKQWKEIATGRSLTFDRGMIIPSKELKNGEICVPWLEPGEKVLNFRSPFLNSNGLCVSTNKIVDDCKGPNEKDLEGIIVVNDEDYARMSNRLKGEGVDPEDIPRETESERQARDFDGDCIGVELASNYPSLTAEAQYRNQKENAYTPTVKQQKQSFYESDGTQKEFEEIALYMTGGNVGTINNQVTALEALESEIEILKTYGTPEQQNSYVQEVAEHYKKLFYLEKRDNEPKPIRAEYKAQMKEFVKLASNNSPENTVKAMAINRSMYRNLIEEGCYQNQIAVDMMKSSKAPDMDLVNENRRYLYRKVNYIKDKKSPQAYLASPIAPSGRSPVELLISQTNKYFESSPLESRMAVQFANLFKGVKFSAQQKISALMGKLEYDQKSLEAIRLNNRLKTDPGPSLTMATNSGKTLDLTNIAKYNHPLALTGKDINLKLEETKDSPPRLLAVAQIDGEMEEGKPKYRECGTVAQADVIAHQLKAGMVTQGVIAEVVPEIQKGQVDLLFAQAREIATNFSASIPPSHRTSAAAAAWNISTTRENEETTSTEPKKVSSFVFVAFSNEISQRLDTLQFDKFKVSGINKGDFPLAGNQWVSGEKYPIEIVKSDDDPKVPRAISITDPSTGYQAVAALEARANQLPINTTAQGLVSFDSSATLTATVAISGKPPVEFTIREIGKFDYSDRVFQNKEANLTIGSSLVPDSNVKVKLGGKVLGELDPDSACELKDINYLKEGNVLKLKLKSLNIDNEQGAYAIGESPKGKLLKINNTNHYELARKDLTSDEFKVVELSIPQAKRKDAVFLDDKLLGTLHFNKDKEALKQLGLMQSEKLVQGTYKLNSNFTTANIIVDSTTIKYPQEWAKEKNIATATKQQLATLEENILAKVKERPTLLFVPNTDKTLGLAADRNKATLIENWLKASGIEFTGIPTKEAVTESKKGMVVYNLNSETIRPEILTALVTKFGQQLDSSAYNECLNKVPNRPLKIAQTQNNPLHPPKPEREQWEKNLLSIAIQSLGSNSYQQNNSCQTAPLGTNHTIIYDVPKKELSIANNSSGQFIYQTTNGQPANISNLSEKQKQHFSDRPPSINCSTKNQASHKIEQNSSTKQTTLSTSQNKLSPGEVNLSSNYDRQADLKIAVTGFAKGNSLLEIERDIESQSKFINSLKNSGASIRTLAKIIPYLDEICTEAEATFKSLPETEIKQLRDRVTTEPNHKPNRSSELSKNFQIPNCEASTSDIEP
jgi:hypothetical protein